MKRNSFSIKSLCLIVVCLLSSPLSAIMKGLSTEELTRESETVIIGVVENVESQWSKDSKTIVSKATVRISEVIRGRVLQQRITVEYEGGEIGDIGLRVSDIDSLRKGERVLLFLRSGKSKTDGPVHNIVGKAQGKYTIDDSGIARKKGFALADAEEAVDNDIPLNVLIDKIRGVK